MTYYWFNRKEVLQNAKDRYHNCGGKEKAAECYLENRWGGGGLKEKAKKNKHKRLSEKEKKIKKKIWKEKIQKLERKC